MDQRSLVPWSCAKALDARRAPRDLQKRVLEVLDHDAVGARAVPAGGIVGARVEEAPQQSRDGGGLVRGDRRPQDDVAEAVPLREVGLAEDRRHGVDRGQFPRGGLRHRCGRDPGIVARHLRGIGRPGGSEHPGLEGVEIGPRLSQMPDRLLDPEPEHVEQDLIGHPAAHRPPGAQRPALPVILDPGDRAQNGGRRGGRHGGAPRGGRDQAAEATAGEIILRARLSSVVPRKAWASSLRSKTWGATPRLVSASSIFRRRKALVA